MFVFKDLLSASLLDILISAFIGVTSDNVAFVVLSALIEALIKLFFMFMLNSVCMYNTRVTSQRRRHFKKCIACASIT